MNDEALTRYSRHILLNEWGVEAQDKLSAAKVLIIGMGGLGCPAAHALAAAGVGHLTIADGDVVDATNLQRQHLHTSERVGMSKVLSAQIALRAINPLCSVTSIAQRLLGDALTTAVAAHDIVLDCSDNFATRHAINRTCVAARKPLFSGAAIRFDGQFIVFNAADPTGTSACYHCLFPEQGVEDEADRCAVMGVFAPLTTQIGNLQAAAAIKWLTSVGTVPVSTLTIVNALNSTQHSIAVPRDRQCAVCAKND
jgi:molybdopterin-synthase adenylyltransferase